MPDKSDARRELERRVDRHVRRARAHQEAWDPLYRDGRNYVFANQLAGKEIKPGWEAIELNHLFPAVTQEQSLLSQRHQMIQALPWEGGDEEGAEVMGNALQWQYKKGVNVPMMLLYCVMDGKTHGHWFVRVEWDDEAEWNAAEQRWEGAVKARLVRPEAVCFDPDCDDVTDPGWAFELREMTVAAAKRKWPDFDEDIEAAGREAETDTEEAIIARARQNFADHAVPVEDETGALPGTDSRGRLAKLLMPGRAKGVNEAEGAADAPEKVIVLRMIMKDDERVEDEVTDHVYGAEELIAEGKIAEKDATVRVGKAKGGAKPPSYVDPETGEPIMPEQFEALARETRKVSRPLYPHGRYIVRIGETIVEDRPWDHRHWPWVAGHNLLLPHTWHGLNAVEMAKGLQDFVNVSARHFINYIKFFGDPVTIVEQGALPQDPENRNIGQWLRAAAGSVWAVIAGGKDKIRREPPPPMSEGALKIYNLISDQLKDQTGIHDIALGRQAKGGMTATESVELATMARMRTALQSVLIDDFVVRLMTVVQELMQANMQVGQMARIVGEGTPVEMVAVTQEMLDARFDLELKVTTELPFDQQREKEEALQLFQVLGLPYLEELLDAFGVENKDELLAKVAGYQALLAATQEMQAQQQAQQQAQTQPEQAGAPSPAPQKAEAAA